VRIERGRVIVRGPAGDEETLAAARVYLLTGFHPDFDLFRRIGIRLDPETMVPEHRPETLETNVPGVHLAGSIAGGRQVSQIFIENGRFDGEKIFGS
jgi:thioredoxin reductase (NADPH)